ncbi:hypothetical protein VNO77_44025 [Canavalia gladiata]|uniref:Uncharacterized protein n=1 Tax=Canavalia gladiata TaxID=3824 RepID=A0AAN9JV64_CANGL
MEKSSPRTNLRGSSGEGEKFSLASNPKEGQEQGKEGKVRRGLCTSSCFKNLRVDCEDPLNAAFCPRIPRFSGMMEETHSYQEVTFKKPHEPELEGDGYMVGRLVVLAYNFSSSCLLSIKPFMLTHVMTARGVLLVIEFEHGVSYGVLVDGEMMHEWHTIIGGAHRA